MNVGIVTVTALLLAAVAADGDDFDLLSAGAQSRGVVSVLVTGWHPITGDMAPQGSSGDGMVAITGDEFVQDLRTASDQVAVTRRYDNLPVLAMTMDGAALRRAKSQSGVELWEDPLLWPLLSDSTEMVGASEAWRRDYTGLGVVVAVIDDGVDIEHPFFGRQAIFEACFADRCPNGRPQMVGPGAAQPVGTHGTHVAGIVLGRSGPDGLSGVGPALHLVMINVANRDADGMKSNSVIAALDLIITLARYNPGVIGAVNMSLGVPRNTSGVCRSRAWDLASALLRQHGVAVVVASGNDSSASHAEPVRFPACVEGFIGVGAVSKAADVADLSNSGPTLELLAPGVEILSSVFGSSAGRMTRGFARLSGTSMAAPHVAAALALLHQAAPGSTVAERVRALQETGRPVTDARSGIAAPLIHVGRAIKYLHTEASSAQIGAPSSVRQPLVRLQLPDDDEDAGQQWESITGG
ncbi:MAG: S8 family serine peptidase [Spirochaetaceae bacterium]|nr:S8 family serine peptidase [Spirochaetaceae bacterium]